jgi:hypothetical protein
MPKIIKIVGQEVIGVDIKDCNNFGCPHCTSQMFHVTSTGGGAEGRRCMNMSCKGKYVAVPPGAETSPISVVFNGALHCPDVFLHPMRNE